MANRPRPALVAVIMLAAACAEPNPFPPPPVEALLVANTTAATVSVIPIEGSGGVSVALSGVVLNDFDALGSLVLASLPNEDAADLLNLNVMAVVMTIALPAGSGATGTVVLSDTVGYVANPNLNSVTRIDLTAGDTASIAVGVYPQGLIAARGRLFVLNGNVAPCGQPGGLCSLGPSWVTVIDPATNALADGTDSIPLLGPGNARYATLGRDGLLYVMVRGTGADSRLSIVDPVGRQEIASFGGFGASPGQMAADPGERILISSETEGVMVFNTRTRTVERGSGNGVAVPDNSGIAVDAEFRSYAIQSGGCAGDDGQAAVLDSTLALVRSIPLGTCAREAQVTLLPAGAIP
jgi:hypothetical protein